MVIRELFKPISESSDRREQSFQRQLNQAIQSIEEATKRLQSSYYPYWYANPTGSSGSMGAGWDIGLRATPRDKSYEVQG